ncbi:hypothetical protein FHR83_007026 [Actinoplanes campanulatus]|uniref:Uncharacterized protein n=1 Tax=Actinoplanes campanulatus TaxID=113559 RepID=A0A7W5ANH3_9ACTN|nr:hypothetical protein [Actinoplanes campanulatus]MBB3099320.1 hypothetical protein [Actinoplanes campanulatus]GGN40493.1 hypothetical protein GCM10010109_69650 [Actinoplanes campanulatus]GID40638.1 hypothetical protein Aca09nite_71440 [Actinoplanes campanulatus]
MPFPGTLTLVTVGIQCDLPPSGAATGWFEFTAARPLLGGADNSIVPPFTLRADLAADGSGSVQLPANNDPQWSPTGWSYAVEGRVNGATITGTLQLDYQTASVQLADLLQVDGTATAGTSYLLTSQRSVASGVAGLDADGDVIDAAGNKIVGGGASGTPAGTVTAETSYGRSSTAGAASTYSRGDHTHGTPAAPTASQISDSTATGRAVLTAADAAAARTAIGAGTSSLALGETDSTAAAGDHTHAGGGTVAIAHGYVTTGDVTPQTIGSWAALTGGPTFSIAAVAGDAVEFSWAGLQATATGLFWDLCVLVDGSPVRYASTGTGTPAIEGDPGLYPDSAFRSKPGLGMVVTCESGDLSGGTITFGFAILNPSGGGKLYAGAAYPLRYRVANWGS